MKSEKGITLIALIITIIVMLILVAVTINVALNGGLFNNAKEASDKTQREAEREELIATMIGAYNNRGSFKINNAKNDLPEGVIWCTAEDTVYSETDETTPEEETWEGSWVITKNNNKFYIDEDGNVLDKEPIASEWWYNHGLTTKNVKYDVSYKDGNDEFIINSQGGFTKLMINGTDNANTISDIIVNGGFWSDSAFMYANNNIFYFLQGTGNSYYIFYFDNNKVKVYLQPNASTTNVSRENYVADPNNTPIKTYTR